MVSVPAVADVGITARVAHHDNPRRLEETTEDDISRSLAVDAGFERETERFAVNFGYRAGKQDFKKDLVQDRTTIVGSGTLTWKAIPETLFWDLTNSRTNNTIDFSQAENTDNQQVVNVTQTGPRLALQLSEYNILNASLNYSTADYERSGRLDQERKIATLGYTRIISDVLSASLGVSYIETEFDQNIIDSNYDITDYSLVLDYLRDNLSLSLELGQYSIKRDFTGTQHFPLRGFHGAYQLNSFADITFDYSETVVDLLGNLGFWLSNNDVLFDDDYEFEETFGGTNTGSLFKNKSRSVGYSYRNETSFNFYLRYSEFDREYLSNFRDESQKAISAGISRSFGPSLTASLSAQTSDREFQLSDSLQERDTFRFSANYRFNEQLRFQLSYARVDQSSDTATFNFDDAVTALSASFRF